MIKQTFTKSKHVGNQMRDDKPLCQEVQEFHLLVSMIVLAKVKVFQQNLTMMLPLTDFVGV